MCPYYGFEKGQRKTYPLETIWAAGLARPADSSSDCILGDSTAASKVEESTADPVGANVEECACPLCCSQNPSLSFNTQPAKEDQQRKATTAPVIRRCAWTEDGWSGAPYTSLGAGSPLANPRTAAARARPATPLPSLPRPNA
ncbi:hypothetical protein C2845_PM05G03740 [Panicum miliaceum]|uniref:Uncharacterized protein n=1 Tax=Panicum miliaceum TaxID=4540 RepID=A0A3L6SWC4_PANMI|nr:hypothetical protein C2845_PM05G03740 [Panicum miliaceum]